MKQYVFLIRSAHAQMGAYSFSVFSESEENARSHAYEFSKTIDEVFDHKIELSTVCDIKEGKSSHYYDEWL